MLRKILFGSSLLLASGTVSAEVEESAPILDQEPAFLETDYSFPFDENDIEKEDDLVIWHKAVNKGNAPVDPSFHLIDDKLIAMIDLNGIDPDTVKVVDTGGGFLTVKLQALSIPEDTEHSEEEIELIIHTLNAPTDSISAELSKGDKALLISVPITTDPREIQVQLKQTLEEISAFKSVQNAAKEKEEL